MQPTSTAALVRTCAALAALSLVGCTTQPPAQPLSVHREQVITASATVKKVDMKSRKLTLVGPDGKSFVVNAGEEVRNLAQVRVGDTVTATFYESVAAEIRPPTDEERANPTTYAAEVAAAAVGEKPGAVGAQTIRLVGKITTIDKATDRVTVTDLDGGVITVKAQDPRNLDKVKIGDPVVLTLTEAVAISVDPSN